MLKPLEVCEIRELVDGAVGAVAALRRRARAGARDDDEEEAGGSE